MQRCPARFLAGRTIRFESEVRTHGVAKWAGLWLRADGDEQNDLYFDNMHRRPIHGTTEWTFYRIDAQLPERTAWLNYGVVLVGNGRVWVDNCSLLVWNEDGVWSEW